MDKNTTKVMFSSKGQSWSTPNDFYAKLNLEFGFTLDPCATEEDTKCENYHTSEDDGLAQDWSGNIVFCNPPYDNMKGWAKKCYEESLKPNTKVILLCPARPDTRYFREYIMKAKEIRFVEGRLKFGESKNPAPFPSMIAVFDSNRTPIISTMTR